jgi:hypothetical protein
MMLTDADLLLLAAAADGDLSPDQAAAARRLLAEHPAAAGVLDRLKADAARLKALPRRPAPPALAAAVLARVSARPVSPDRRSSRRTAWAPYAVAAAVLLAVGVGSFLFFRTPDDGLERAMRGQLPALTPAPKPESQKPVAFAKRNAPPADPEWVAKGGPESERLAPPRVLLAQDPQPVEPANVLGSGVAANMKPLAVVEMKLPVLVAGTTLDQRDVQATLERELGRDPAYRLDLFSKTPAVALDQLQAAARNAGVTVFVDATAAELMKKPLNLTFAVYFENLTPAELANVLAATARQVNAQPNPETVLGTAALIPAAVVEQKDVRDLVGVEIGAARPAPVKAAEKPDEPKPVSADTLAKVTAAVKKPEKAAVVVTYLPANLRAGANKSAEVKQFLDKRVERKPGTVPLLVVVR